MTDVKLKSNSGVAAIYTGIDSLAVLDSSGLVKEFCLESGSLTIDVNGTYDVRGKESVSVTVSGGTTVLRAWGIASLQTPTDKGSSQIAQALTAVASLTVPAGAEIAASYARGCYCGALRQDDGGAFISGDDAVHDISAQIQRSENQDGSIEVSISYGPTSSVADIIATRPSKGGLTSIVYLEIQYR